MRSPLCTVADVVVIVAAASRPVLHGQEAALHGLNMEARGPPPASRPPGEAAHKFSETNRVCHST